MSNKQYTIPKDLPSDAKLEENYQWVTHQLAKLPEFHFRMLLHKEWKAANYGLDEDPELNKLKYVALITSGDDNGNYGPAESHAGISILVTIIPDEEHDPIDWLDQYVQNYARYEDFNLLDANIYQHKENQSKSFKDQLFSYKIDGQTYVRRTMAYQTGRVYIIFEGASKEELYNDMSEAIDVGITSISFIKNDE